MAPRDLERISSNHSIHTMSETLLFRPPNPNKVRHEFKIGDTVRISRLVDTFTDPSMIGHVGTIVEQDDSWPFAFLCDVACATCHSTHTMNEEELDLQESSVLATVREKAQVDLEYTKSRPEEVQIDATLAVEMTLCGFTHASVTLEKPLMSELPDPGWRRTLLFKVGLCTVKELYVALQGVATAACAKVLSVETYSVRQNWTYLRIGDEETTLLEVPVRAVLVGK